VLARRGRRGWFRYGALGRGSVGRGSVQAWQGTSGHFLSESDWMSRPETGGINTGVVRFGKAGLGCGSVRFGMARKTSGHFLNESDRMSRPETGGINTVGHRVAGLGRFSVLSRLVCFGVGGGGV